MSQPRFGSLVAIVVVILILLSISVPIGTAATPPPDDPAATEQRSAGLAPSAMAAPFATRNASDIDSDSTIVSIDVAANGSAQWRVIYRLRLEDENATEAFESLQADIAANERAYTDRFADRLNRTVESAEGATGRSMSVGPVSISTRRSELLQEYGFVEYDFRWDGFADRTSDRLLVGDAIGGLPLDDGTTLYVEWPRDHRLERVQPTPTEQGDRSVRWRGPLQFEGDQPRLVLAGSTPTASAAAGPESGPVATGEPAQLIGGLLALLLLLVAVWAAYRYVEGRSSDGFPAGETTAQNSDGAVPPEDLLSNDERVIQLLEANDGRMKQQAIADELEWTDAKTSQVIGDLRESERVETFRLGRENVVTLPDAGGPIE